MINVNEFQNHLYLQWAGQVFEADKENWSVIPQWHLNKIAKDKEWSYINCKSNNITYLELIQNVFWQEVVAVCLDNKNNTKLQNSAAVQERLYKVFYEVFSSQNGEIKILKQ